MIGVVTRDSAQRRPSDKHRSDARNFLLIADRLSPDDRLAAVTWPILPVPDLRLRRRRGLHPSHDDGACSQHIHRDLHRDRAPQWGSRKRGPSIERGHCGDRHITPDRLPGPLGRHQAARRPRRSLPTPWTTTTAASAASLPRCRIGNRSIPRLERPVERKTLPKEGLPGGFTGNARAIPMPTSAPTATTVPAFTNTGAASTPCRTGSAPAFGTGRRMHRRAARGLRARAGACEPRPRRGRLPAQRPVRAPQDAHAAVGRPGQSVP